jgi:hypothetical protein
MYLETTDNNKLHETVFEKLTVAQLATNLPALYGAWRPYHINKS